MHGHLQKAAVFLPPATLLWAQKTAAEHGLGFSAWLRQLLIQLEQEALRK